MLTSSKPTPNRRRGTKAEAKKAEKQLAAEQAQLVGMPNGPKKMLKEKALKLLALQLERVLLAEISSSVQP